MSDNNQKKYLNDNGLSRFLEKLKTIFSPIEHDHTLSEITDYVVDEELSPTSTNPVQNKVLDAEFEAMSEAMLAYGEALAQKAPIVHDHNDVYYTETEVDTKLSGKSDATHKHDDAYDAKGSADSALDQAKAYTDDEIALLLNNSSEAVDSIMELAKAMEENNDVVVALEQAIGNKASESDFIAHAENTENPHAVTKEQIGLSDVENKNSETIRGELTTKNVTDALGHTPLTATEINDLISDAVANKASYTILREW